MLKYLNFQKFGCQIKIIKALLKIKISIEKNTHMHILLYTKNKFYQVNKRIQIIVIINSFKKPLNHCDFLCKTQALKWGHTAINQRFRLFSHNSNLYSKEAGFL